MSWVFFQRKQSAMRKTIGRWETTFRRRKFPKQYLFWDLQEGMEPDTRKMLSGGGISLCKDPETENAMASLGRCREKLRAALVGEWPLWCDVRGSGPSSLQSWRPGREGSKCSGEQCGAGSQVHKTQCLFSLPCASWSICWEGSGEGTQEAVPAVEARGMVFCTRNRLQMEGDDLNP